MKRILAKISWVFLLSIVIVTGATANEKFEKDCTTQSGNSLLPTQEWRIRFTHYPTGNGWAKSQPQCPLGGHGAIPINFQERPNMVVFKPNS